MLTNKLKEQPANKPVRLHNVVCPYCGVPIVKENLTKEHLIGRKFVPKRTLENSWNLILNACRGCNNGKADLEDDISAITMQPDVRGQHFGDHPQLALDAARKAGRTHSRHTGKFVGESGTSMEIKHEFAPGVTMTFNMVGQPQIAEERAFELALRHFQAFFYFITYNHQEKRGWWWTGSYAPILAISKNDWGNDLARGFMETTWEWDTRVLAITANEHFKLAIRRHPNEEIWSLAVEWNENYRVIAACGKDEGLRPFLVRLPKLKLDTVSKSSDTVLRVRTEQRLALEDDTLFVTGSEITDRPLDAI